MKNDKYRVEINSYKRFFTIITYEKLQGSRVVASLSQEKEGGYTSDVCFRHVYDSASCRLTMKNNPP